MGTFCHRPETNMRVIFLSDNDVGLTQHHVRGVDVWIKTLDVLGSLRYQWNESAGEWRSEPKRARCWWAEAYTPDLGWALGDAQEHGERCALVCCRSRPPLRHS